MNRIRIKMCGTTNIGDALAAVESGVDALGFIFTRKSPRYIEPDQAGKIIAALPPFITRVGVFVDSSIAAVQDIIRIAGLTQVQLHGSESVDFCRELKFLERSCSICKAFRIGSDTMDHNIGAYGQAVDSVLLDTYQQGLEGGTGAVFDWKLIAQLQLEKPLILAGGLNPENVAKAVRNVRPYGIDINSGVEDAPGKKNHQLLKALVDTVYQTQRELLSQT